jgi:restriction system protein
MSKRRWRGSSYRAASPVNWLGDKAHVPYKARALSEIPYISPDIGRPECVESGGRVSLDELSEITANALRYDSRFPTGPTVNPYLARTPPRPAILDKPTAPPAPIQPDSPPWPQEPKRDDYLEKIGPSDALLIIPALMKSRRATKRLAVAQIAYREAIREWNRTYEPLWIVYRRASEAHRLKQEEVKKQTAEWARLVAADLRTYWDALEQWKGLKDEFDRSAAVDRPRLSDLRRRLRAGDAAAIDESCCSALARSPYPAAFPFDVTLTYIPDSRLLYVAYLLPNIEEMRVYKRGRGSSSVNTVPVTKTELRNLVNLVPYAVTVRTLSDIVRADEDKNIDACAFNGMLRFIDPATGQTRTECILSVLVGRPQIEAVAVERVDPLECFRSWKGIAAPQLAERVPVAPVLRLDTHDRRIIEQRDVAETLSPDTNLAAMPWEDFEHFVREVFEREFMRDGVEVRVTQSSRDRGVDAIVFDPDPVKGGKIVIQAKRYTRVVDVSAVRDLYGTVHNEGATKGILVATSSFGRDSYEFAAGKPLALIDGSNLLFLLKKHGFQKFRIDLEEARRLEQLANR